VHEYDLANNYYTLALESSHALDVLYSQAKVYSLLGELDKAEKILHILLLYKKDDPIYQQLEKNIALVRD
jgi:predicted Zn-dependent protease